MGNGARWAALVTIMCVSNGAHPTTARIERAITLSSASVVGGRGRDEGLLDLLALFHVDAVPVLGRVAGRTTTVQSGVAPRHGARPGAHLDGSFERRGRTWPST